MAAPEAEKPSPGSEFGCCWRCSLRISGCRDTELYVKKADAAPDGCAEDACGLCLGLLEQGSHLRVALAEKIRAMGSEASSYTMSLVMPVLYVFRHNVLLCHLRAGDSGPSPAGGVVELKDVLRWLLSEELSSLGLEGVPDPDNPALTVAVACEYSGHAISELGCLDGLGGGRRKPHKGSRKKRKRGDEGAAAAVAAAAAAQGETPGEAAAQGVAATASTAAVVEALSGLSSEDCLELVGGTSLADSLRRITGPPAATRFVLGRESLYLRGRYLKMSRNMPQSLWILDGERKGEGSVEESICGPAAKLFGASECKFHAEGREDIDVRMLGSGRTFVVEVKNALRSTVPCAEVQAAVNAEAGGKVEVRGLQRCPASAMGALQKDAENHRKTYVCVCWSQRALSASDIVKVNSHKDLEIQQKTPVRVLHRRAPAIRPRTLHWLEASLLNSHYLTVRLSTQAGMYIKEFVHSDLGRTQPSLQDLLGGGRVEILQLDVEGLED